MQNISLNKVRNRLTAILGDAEAITKSLLLGKADRILMPLPEKAYEYLDAAIKGLKPSGGLIHYYDFEHAKKGESPIEKVERKVSEKLERLNVDFEIPFQRIVRGVGPNWLQIVLDIVVKR
jgi:tRNA (guanine37-N1)-methyltransferase